MRRSLRKPVLGRSDQFLAPPQQTRSLEKRRRLLEAARMLFGKKGYDATSIGDITSTAGTAAGAFYTYFRSKQQLLVVLMNELIERLSSVSLSPGDAGTEVDRRGRLSSTSTKAGLRLFLAAVFRTDLEYFGVIRAWQEATLSDPDLSRMRREVESWTEKRILTVFKQLQQNPNARAGCDVPSFARMMDRHFWSVLGRGASLSQRDFDREIEIASDVIYHYLFHDGPRPVTLQ